MFNFPWYFTKNQNQRFKFSIFENNRTNNTILIRAMNLQLNEESVQTGFGIKSPTKADMS